MKININIAFNSPLIHSVRKLFASKSKLQKISKSLGALALMLLAACGDSSNNTSSPEPTAQQTPTQQTPAQQTPAQQTEYEVRFNQVAYPTGVKKFVIIESTTAEQFELKNTLGETVFQGSVSPAQTWSPAGASQFQLIDFSGFDTEGNYTLAIDGQNSDATISILNTPYAALLTASLKAYYFNRASTDLTPEYAGQWSRLMGHADNEVQIHELAASSERPASSVFSAAKGWYDAGDFGKYVVNSGISTYTLLHAYRTHKKLFNNLETHIPESNNDQADILDEVLWNLDWLENMQDPNDGGVYHKLTAAKFSDAQMPNEDRSTRYFVKKSTAAALNFTAIMATAAQIFSEDNQQNARAARYQSAALLAWQWAQANPDLIYSQDSQEDVVTGAYDDQDLRDEFAWAATELFLLTGDDAYKQHFESQLGNGFGVPWWRNVNALASFSILSAKRNAVENDSEFNFPTIEHALITLADSLTTKYLNSSYKNGMHSGDFVWGSNSVQLNSAWVLHEAYKINANTNYLDAAQGYLDFVLGRNPTGYSFVTGFGSQSPMHIHHRASEADSIAEPIPGFVAGGPQPGQQDGCIYSSPHPAASYVDDWCSYASNEVAINWNAPLVAVLANIVSRTE